MSDFSKKTLAGEPATAAEWKAHLLEAHRAAPGMSPPLFGRCRDSRGRTPYEALAAALRGFKKPATVVDLACGNGPLIPHCLKRLPPRSRIVGVDMSRAELALARKADLGPGVDLRLGRAEALPLPDASADAVLCHMALMLMVPLEPVLAEVLRVLKPGGTFAAMVFHPPAAAGVYKSLIAAAGAFLRTEFPRFRAQRTTDERLQTQEGLAQLFLGPGSFRRIKSLIDQPFSCRLRPEETWDMVKDMYLIGMLTPEPKRRLRAALIAAAAAEAAGGRVRFAIPCRLIILEK